MSEEIKVDIVPMLGPLSEETLTLIEAGLEIPNLAGLRAMVREIRAARAKEKA